MEFESGRVVNTEYVPPSSGAKASFPRREMPSTACFESIRSFLFLSFPQEWGWVHKGVAYLDFVVVQSAFDERLGGAVDFTVWDVENVGDTLPETENKGTVVGGGLHDLQIMDTSQLDVIKEEEGVRVVTDVEEDLWNCRVLQDRLKGDVWVFDANGGKD